MTLGSFAHGALAELTPDDLERMLNLDETLFVEHKSDLRAESAHGIVEAIASFANTLGGWLLIGVHNGKPLSEPGRWASGPPLVDAVRDRLRMELDPLPAFEARTMSHPDGPVGVVRVYESADTPHVALSSGAVFVREVAGKADVADPKKPGAGRRAERAYAAARVRSRAQLLELAERGRRANERVLAMVDPARPLPLIANALGLHFEQRAGARMHPRLSEGGTVFVRLLPYTVAPRFQGWSTTAEASATVLRAAEDLARMRGLSASWLTPHPSGASLTIGAIQARHHDAADGALESTARVVVDGAGVVGGALQLAAPDEARRRWMGLHEIAEALVEPVIVSAASMLRDAKVIGRCWCQIDLVGLSRVLLVEGQRNREGAEWVPTGADLTLPAEASTVEAVGRRAVFAYARSAGVPAWDPA